MDERELKTIFADAVGEPPPPGFDMGDIATASARARARHRSAIALACGCLVLVLAGLGVVGYLVNSPSSPVMSAASAPDPRSGAAGQPGMGPERPSLGGKTPDFPTQSPMQGGDGPGKNGPRAESASGCDKVDGELATALAGELPVTVKTADANPGRVCVTQTRAAGFRIEGGWISVLLVAPGVILDPSAIPVGSARSEVLAAGGGTIDLISTPGPGTSAAPLADDLPRLAGTIASHF
jgi:hypothetical protein